MTGQRGNSEVQVKACALAEDKSEALTKCNVIHIRIINHPVEGICVSGDERIARRAWDTLKAAGFEQWVARPKCTLGMGEF